MKKASNLRVTQPLTFSKKKKIKIDNKIICFFYSISAANFQGWCDLKCGLLSNSMVGGL